MKVKTRKGGPITIEVEELKDVEKFTSLGSIISKTGDSDDDIKSRISKAQQAFAMLKPVWSSATLRESTTIRIFNTNVKSVLLYGYETWRLTTGLQQKIQVFTNKCLQHICKVAWPRKLSNEQLLEHTCQESTLFQKKKEHGNRLGTHGESPKTKLPKRH